MDINVTEPQRIYYEPHVYSSFPDIIRDFDGNFLCVFRIGDDHHPTSSVLMLSRSSDGENWETEEFATASLEDDGYVFNCPRLNNVQGRISLFCDTKTSTKEAHAQWDISSWWSKDGKKWGEKIDHGIAGIAPDKIVPLERSLALGYHIPEVTKRFISGAGTKSRLVQMMAESFDEGETWRDRSTIAAHDKHSFCEGSIVRCGDRAMCFLRDNKSSTLRSHLAGSIDCGKTWNFIQPLHFSGHRIVAAFKQKEPYKDLLIGTFRNTTNRTLSMFVQNMKNSKIQTFTLDTETNFSLFNYGYSGWVEKDDGSIQVVYYIQRNNPNPEIVTVNVSLY